MLSDSSHEIRQQADSALSEFLQEIKNSPVRLLLLWTWKLSNNWSASRVKSSFLFYVSGLLRSWVRDSFLSIFLDFIQNDFVLYCTGVFAFIEGVLDLSQIFCKLYCSLSV